MGKLDDDLRDEISHGQVLAVVGAGVSVGATQGAGVASWMGLLQNGVDCCESLKRFTAQEAAVARQNIQVGTTAFLLAAAELVDKTLGWPDDGEYKHGLRETVGALKAIDNSALEALRDLQIPLATTNYDGLLEEVTGLPAVTWKFGSDVERVLRGDDRAILHLHGYWKRSDSVILGIRAYERIRGDQLAQHLQRVLRSVHTLLFVGCGEGLSDPNFGVLLEWSRGVFAGSEYRHYRLARDSELETLQRQHPPAERIVVLGYGASHNKLAAYLRSLIPAGQVPIGGASAKPAEPFDERLRQSLGNYHAVVKAEWDARWSRVVDDADAE